ncbi:MAG TPA: hypothetical protein VLD16_03355 [Gaiellaceae bacterium]|nr:hypothetical protein [Gaiellaceae bacterium]
MGRSVMAVAAACVALVAASARAQPDTVRQVVLAPSVSATRAVPASATTSFVVTCRTGYTSVSAGIASPAPGTTVLAIAPVGLSGYRFRIANPAATGDQRVTVVVACRKIGSGASRFVLRLKPLKPKTVVVRPGRTAAATLACPKGTTPANGGFAFGSTSLSLRRDAATLTSASYSVANSGSRARRAVFFGGCLTLFRTADSPFEQLHVRVTTFRVPLRPGAQTLQRRCRSGWFSLDTGYALRSPATELDGAVPTTGGARWRLTNGSDGAVVADVQLACGRLGP